MKLFKKILKILLILLILLLITTYFFSRSLKPDYKGTIAITALSDEVEVYYDSYGIPHIYAQNELDARRALGYVHAQDRLWQMELIRRLAAGRISELFGEKALRTDKFFSGLGIEEASAKTIENLDSNSEVYQLTMAYIDGINQFIENGPTPIEYYLLGVKKEKYTLKDMYNVFGYMSFSFAIAHKTDPVLTEIKEKLGNDYLKELDINIQGQTLIKNGRNAILEGSLSRAVHAIFEELPISPFIGSNSWVLGPEKTKNGKVIFANDPHIAYAQPSVWYQSHISTPTYEIYGYNLALTPFPLLGHNRNYAYGLTMFANDDVDFYFEEDNPNKPNEYLTPNGSEAYSILKKTIKIKDAEPLSYDIKVSKHGPVMNGIIDHIDDERPMAMDWVYTKFPNKLLEVGYTMSHSQSLNEFKKAAEMIHAPGLNVMYGDASNNIAWFASAKLYKFKNDVNRSLVLNGNSLDDQKEYLDFEQNPQAINPAWRYVYSANNQPDSIAGMIYPGYYQPQDRAKRIVHLLEAKNDFSKEDVMAMINDVTSATTPAIVKDIVLALDPVSLSDEEQKALEILQQWDGNYNLESVAPTIYNRLQYELLARTYKDELGKTFNIFLNTSLQKKTTPAQIARDTSVWWDDVQTLDVKETRKDILSSSLKETLVFLKKQLGDDMHAWTWNKVHTIEHKHPVGQVPALRSYFNVGPFEINGGKEVINNLAFNLDSTGYYKVSSGPSTRRVIDFSDVEGSMSIIPTGQSGNPLSSHYRDQAEKYNKGEFVPMLLNKERIQDSKMKLVLKPKK